MRKVALVTAALVVAVIFFLLATLPPRPVAVTSTVDPERAAPARSPARITFTPRGQTAPQTRTRLPRPPRAPGLAFIILTDHGDGTAQPDLPAVPPRRAVPRRAWRSARTAATTSRSTCRPRRIRSAGSRSAVVEDVKRLGGFGIVAHPDSAKDATGLERLGRAVRRHRVAERGHASGGMNRAPDSARVLFDYFLRPAPALALDARPPGRNARALGRACRTPACRGDRRQRRARRDRTGDGGGREAPSAFGGVPSYEASFRTFTHAGDSGTAAFGRRGV